MSLFHHQNTIPDSELKAAIGVVGGSGFYSLFDDARHVTVETPYGPTSDVVSVGTIKGKTVAFIPRHGSHHSIPPHKINYRANMWALKSLGVKFVISPCAAGSLKSTIKPGDFVVMDQFVDRTKHRHDTYYDGPVATHMSFANPYCSYLRGLAIDAITEQAVPCHKTGTVVVIEGPRFSSVAESQWFISQGWDAINMTQYPEVVLANELEMAVVNIALITDYDSGVAHVQQPETVDDLLTVFKQNINHLKASVLAMIQNLDINHKSAAHDALSRSRF